MDVSRVLLGDIGTIKDRVHTSQVRCASIHSARVLIITGLFFILANSLIAGIFSAQVEVIAHFGSEYASFGGIAGRNKTEISSNAGVRIRASTSAGVASVVGARVLVVANNVG